MDKKPLISIITVVYNGLQLLPRTIASVRGQSYQELEYIMIDGGSTDGTPSYLATHQNWFHYWVSEPDAGLYDAMNKGLDRASGDFCLFLNAGDLFYAPDSLEKMVAAIVNMEAYYFGTAIMTDEANIYRLNPRQPIRGIYHPDQGLPNHQASLFPRAFYAVNRYDLNFKLAADDDYKLRALSQYPAHHIDLPVVIFALGGLSRDVVKWRSVRTRFQDTLLMNRKHFGGNWLRYWRTFKFFTKTVLLFLLQSLTGPHWRYELWFNKFQRIPPGELERFQSTFAENRSTPSNL